MKSARYNQILGMLNTRTLANFEYEGVIRELLNEIPIQTSMPKKQLHKEIRRLMQDGRKIEAVKLVRREHCCGLKDAKDYVEALYGVTTVYRPVRKSQPGKTAVKSQKKGRKQQTKYRKKPRLRQREAPGKN